MQLFSKLKYLGNGKQCRHDLGLFAYAILQRKLLGLIQAGLNNGMVLISSSLNYC